MTARIWTALVILLVLAPSFLSAAPLRLEKGDHVVWIGNTFAERMQYFGEVEARLHARFSKHDLVVRNLAWSADTIRQRPRPKDFGDIHHYLSELKADVILACYGFNETWDYGGEAGLTEFQADLTNFLVSLQSRKYNGKSAPKIVLYSPIACEADVVPDSSERNRLLQLYSRAMKESADALNIPFVDLFAASRELFRASAEPVHTINGIHLTAGGYARLAAAILPVPIFNRLSIDAGVPLDAVRAEVLEKNDTFFDWYRTVNSFYIHGSRKRPFGVVNFPAERKKLLQMTSVRDQRIWRAARGERLPVEIDDSSTIEIPATLPSSSSGTSPALSPAAERDKFDVAEGFRVELFASEQDFPELRNPVSMNFDTKGRLWIATMPSYPHALPDVKPNDQIIILEDTDRDGKADKRTVFAENLYLPLGFELGFGGVFVSQEPNLVFLEDTNNDDRADKKTILLHGFGSEDSHHAIHMFIWGPGGGLYMQESVFHHTQVETIYGPRRSIDNAIYRFDPRTLKLDIAARLPPGGNAWGHAINRWGQHLYVGGHLNPALIHHPGPGYVQPPPYKNTDYRYCEQEFITSHHWPDKYQGLVFSNQYKNYHGVQLHDWTENGSSFDHDRLVDVFESRNQSCIPVDLQLGPDGALYVVDWYNPVLGHMQYSLRDERRDSKMGRIWRVTFEGRALDNPPKIAEATVEQLLDHLKAYEDRTRYRARRELWNLPDEVLRPALDKWLASLDHEQQDSQGGHGAHKHHALGLVHHLTEALWLHQQRGWIQPALFQRVSSSSDHNARAAAAHLLRYWADDLPDARSHFVRFARDKHPRVRMEAIASSTWTEASIAIEVLEITRDLPQDSYVKLAWDNARKALGPALENHPMALSPRKLARLPLSEQVIKAVIRRPGLPASLREKVLTHLASKKDITSAAALVEIIQEADTRSEDSLSSWLALLDSKEVAARETVDPLLKSQTPEVRQAAFAALLRSGHLDGPPLDEDALRSLTRIDSRELQRTFLTPAQEALASSSSVKVRQAAAFALGRIPGDDKLLFSTLGKYFAKPELTAAVAEAILARPRETWPEEDAAALLDTHFPRLASTPIDERGEPSFTIASELLSEIAERENRSDTVNEIQNLQLVRVRISTIPDRMMYDRETIQVPPGTPIELHLDNPDAMKHNLVICAAGALEKVGLAADALASEPDAMQRDWIPDLPEVLHATPMASPEETVVVRFLSPREPGSYPFICTVPNHWRIMQGTMIVSDEERSNVLIVTGEYEYQTRITLAKLGQRLEEELGLDVVHLEANKKATPQHIPGLEKHLADADLLVLSLRFLNLDPDQYQLLDQYLDERPFIAIRTTTHLFRFPSDSSLTGENEAFPDRHFGTPYRGHHGHDTSQVNYVMASRHPVMAGIDPRFWTPDFLYAVNPLSIECTPLMVGQGLDGLQRATFKTVSPNDHVQVLSEEDKTRLEGSPHPVVWTVDNKKDTRRALVSTVGARGSFADPNVQRLYLNAVRWCLGQDSDASSPAAAPLETVLLEESLESLAQDARKIGDVERGRKLFYGAAVGCAKCHDPASGPPLGPNLLKKRETKDTHIVESILKPSAVILECYQNALVVTQDGQTHTGFHVFENDQTLQLRDSVLGEKTWDFKKSELLAWERVNTSTMPVGLVNQLKDRSAFLDLVRFVMAGAEGEIPGPSKPQGAPPK